jgi:flagellar motility protein MotE (MotC chaperone)
VTIGVAVLIAGCATARSPQSSHDPASVSFEQQSAAITERERECEKVAAANQDAATANGFSGTGAASKSSLQPASTRTLAVCQADADRANRDLAARQRAEYESSIREARERAALMMTLTTSLQH